MYHEHSFWWIFPMICFGFFMLCIFFPRRRWHKNDNRPYRGRRWEGFCCSSSDRDYYEERINELEKKIEKNNKSDN